jgi:hypothetical protein
VRLSRQTKELGKEPAVVTEEPGIIVPRDVDQATR